jgi:hypothetical protein
LCFAPNSLCCHGVSIKNKDVRIQIIYCIAANRLAESVLSLARFLLLRRATFLSPPPSSFGGFSATCGLRFFLSKQGFDAGPAGP